ncbi:hypothetical protein DFH08DRAFT_890472 [Mycena albidolilacea]|uniref:RING-type domain-containing protein n=1 Tax=Mycena albidolilacea TaxID=1033008 RepID=A0AAD6ZF29_9AGAR|nr:hypothetical protein DFH08DRAFT_890472 [Mycena albidolilacea]
MVCSICFEKFAAPVALPCGHIFCRECIQHAMEATRSCQPCHTLQHFCPTCRAGYSSVAFDPAILPAYIRPHILPAIRPVFFDDLPPESSAIAADCKSTSATSLAAPTPATDDDAEMLRLSCETWRRRAETHAAANTGLLRFARAAKEYTLRMRLERDQALNCCAVLERKLANLIRAGEVDAFPAEQGPVQHTELSESRMQPNLPPSQSGHRVDLEFDLLTW